MDINITKSYCKLVGLRMRVDRGRFRAWLKVLIIVHHAEMHLMVAACAKIVAHQRKLKSFIVVANMGLTL